MARYILGPHGIYEGDDEAYVRAAGYDPAAARIPTLWNSAQYGRGTTFEWSPSLPHDTAWQSGAESTSPSYVSELLQLRDRVRAGQVQPYERAWYEQQVAEAQAIPTRDVSTLTAGWGGEGADWWGRLDPLSPDVGPIMLQLRDKLERGQATDQERALYSGVAEMANDWSYRASVPQASDANPFGLGDNLFSALAILGLGSGAAAAIAPLAAGAGVTLAGAGAFAGTAGGLAGMLAEPLDSQALRMAGLALGAAGGVTSLGSLLSHGLNSVGDVVSAVQKVYGTSTKARQLVQAAQQAGSNPAAVQAASQATQGRTASSTSQAMTAADQRTQRSTSPSSTASTPGGTPMAEQNPLGPILAGLVGSVGSVLSLADVSRYMSQMKDKFKDDQGQQDLIDQAYELALARYETMYARTEQEYTQKQEAYTKAQERYQTRYDQQQQTWDQQQTQFAKIEEQTGQDRATQYQNYQHNRARVDESYTRQVQEAQAERDFQVNRDSANVAKYDAAYQRQVEEAQADRAKEYAVFDQQYAKYQQNFDRREAQAVEERGLDLNAYQQRQAIGRNLSDPAALKAGAEALYQPLSDLARDRVNTQTEEEMARRGVAGGGMYSNLLAAKAFAPQEQQLWSNALNAYLQGQTGALNAYGQQDMTMSPKYDMVNTPNFTNSPGYQAITAPNLADSPAYSPYNTPAFTQSSQQSVPRAPGYDQAPTVPEYRTPAGVPTARQPGTAATPYAPFGSDAKTGTTAVNNLAGLVTQLARSGVPQQLLKYISGLLGGTTYQDQDFTNANPWAGVDTTDYKGGDFPGDYATPPDYDAYDPWAGVTYDPATDY